jgi:UDP:flavonoid glycosyltransferase YjiC (YdhE family)
MKKDLTKTILVTSMSASMAHVVRPLEVAKVLREIGYRVIFAGSGNPTRLVQQVGFELRYLPDWELPKIAAKLRAGSKEIYPLEQIERWVSAELALYKEVNPILILDDARVTSQISSAVAGLPRVSIQNAYTHPLADRGFMDPNLKSPRSAMEPGDEKSYNVVRQKFGLPSIKNLNEALKGDLNLLCDVPEYAPLQHVPPSYHYVGPITWGHDLLKPSWLDELDPTKPTLYFTMGSTGPREAFQAAKDFLRGDEYQIMMTLGSMVNHKDLNPLPAGFFAASYASGETLARMADATICHAGNGTAYQALRAGVPLITWPSFRDQLWNARRLSELGVSITISSPDQLHDAVVEILENPVYKNNAVKFSKILKKYKGPEKSAELIHNFIQDIN